MQNDQHTDKKVPILRVPLAETYLEACADGVIRLGTDRLITRWNGGAAQIYGYSAEEATGRPLSLLVPRDREPEMEQMLSKALGGETLTDQETVHVARDGRRIDVLITILPDRDAAGAISGVLAIVRDTTESCNSQRELQLLQESARQRLLVLETANRVALDILTSRTGVEALRHIAEAARTLANAQYAALGVARSDGQGLLEFITAGLPLSEEAKIGARPKGLGILSLLLTLSEPLRIDTLSQHPHSVGFPPNHPPMESFLGVPIRRGETVVGSLYLTNKVGGGVFTEADEVAVEALGAQAAVAIHNLHQLLRQRSLVKGLIAAQEEERRAIAYDLHDGLTQFVMASHAHMEAFRRAHEMGNSERAERELDQGLRYLKEAVLESRRLVNGLRSLALDDLGLAGTLEQLVAEEKMRAGWQEADFVHNIAGARYHKTLETTIYRIAQEALTNARKHACASSVRLVLVTGREKVTGIPNLTLEVRDWGKGFVPEQAAAAEGHVGLQSMVERAHLMKGMFSLHSAPGSGTTVRAVFAQLEPEPEETGEKH